MKLTATLSEPNLAALTETCEALAKALAAATQKTKSLGGLLETMAKIETRKAAAEKKAEQGDEKASMRLVALADQRMRLERTIAATEAAAAGTLEPLREKINEASQLVQRIAGPDLSAQLISAVGAAMLPFFHSEEMARQMYRHTDAIRGLGSFLNPPIGNDMETMKAQAQGTLGTLDALIAGGELFTFTPRQRTAAAE